MHFCNLHLICLYKNKNCFSQYIFSYSFHSYARFWEALLTIRKIGQTKVLDWRIYYMPGVEFNTVLLLAHITTIYQNILALPNWNWYHYILFNLKYIYVNMAALPLIQCLHWLFYILVWLQYNPAGTQRWNMVEYWSQRRATIV